MEKKSDSPDEDKKIVNSFRNYLDFTGEADGIIGCGQLFGSGQQRFGESFGSGAEITWN